MEHSILGGITFGIITAALVAVEIAWLPAYKEIKPWKLVPPYAWFKHRFAVYLLVLSAFVIILCGLISLSDVEFAAAWLPSTLLSGLAIWGASRTLRGKPSRSG